MCTHSCFSLSDFVFPSLSLSPFLCCCCTSLDLLRRSCLFSLALPLLCHEAPSCFSKQPWMHELSLSQTHTLPLSLSLFTRTHYLSLSVKKERERVFEGVHTHSPCAAAACLASCHVYCMVSLPKGGLCNEAKGPSRTF